MLASAVSLIDIAMLGRLGTDALAAVGYTTQFFFLSQAMLMAVGIGCVAMMSRSVGAGEPGRAREALAAFLVLAVGLSTLLTAICLLAPRPLLLALNADPAIVEIAVPYFRLTLASTLLMSVTLTYESGFRAAGDTRTPLWIAAGVTLVKLGGNGLLIFGFLGFPRLELVGAGIATLVSQAVALALFLWVAGRRGSETSAVLRIRRADWRGSRRHLREALRLSLPAAAERVFMNLSLMAYFWVLGDYGAVAVAAYTVGVRVLSFSWIPGVGFSVASSTLVGQALGAMDADAAGRAAWRSARLGLIVAVVLGAAYAWARVPLARVFTSDAAVIAALEPFMLMLALAQPFLGLHFTMGGALRGAGDTVTPLWAALLGAWGLRVPIAVFAAWQFPGEVIWVWAALVFDHVARSIWLVLAFRRGRWARNLGVSTRMRGDAATTGG